MPVAVIDCVGHQPRDTHKRNGREDLLSKSTAEEPRPKKAQKLKFNSQGLLQIECCTQKEKAAGRGGRGAKTDKRMVPVFAEHKM
jgi:hypothetical protein